jgi:negative regulator of flagellin synthesis FlgM
MTLISTTHTPATPVITENPAKPVETGRSAPVTSGPIQPRPDQTTVSSASGTIANQLGGSDVRTEKVQALQQATAGGTYNVSSSDVADKIVSSLLGH